LTTAVKDSLRELTNQVSVLNHHVGSRLEMRDVDLGCLDLISRHGPMAPSALARMAGLHAATVTGIIDRLERDGWVARGRDTAAADRRAVTVRALRERGGELYRLYSGMNGALDEICAGYDERELELLAGFLRRAAAAGQTASEDLATAAPPTGEGEPRSRAGRGRGR
jgi:DNA-binding MarR family transcriptional regulator